MMDNYALVEDKYKYVRKIATNHFQLNDILKLNDELTCWTVSQSTQNDSCFMNINQRLSIKASETK